MLIIIIISADNRIEDAGAQAFANALIKNPELPLQSLDLSSMTKRDAESRKKRKNEEKRNRGRKKIGKNQNTILIQL